VCVKCVGGFAFVFVAQDLKDGKEYALKVCSHFIYHYHKTCNNKSSQLY